MKQYIGKTIIIKSIPTLDEETGILTSVTENGRYFSFNGTWKETRFYTVIKVINFPKIRSFLKKVKDFFIPNFDDVFNF